jgi:Rha family phage regulatory protein
MLPAVARYIRADADGVPVVNSRDVAAEFEKEHRHVLRDIDVLRSARPDLGALRWFRRTDYLDEQNKLRPSYDLTRDGFMLLAMGWNGEKALALKIAYIEAFNEMERDARSRGVTTHQEFMEAIREIVRPLSVRFDGQDIAIERLETRVDGMASDVAFIKFQVCKGRRRIPESVKREHVDANNLLGKRCQCCGLATVIDENGNKSLFAEFDHFYTNNNPSVDATWLICKPDHNKLTTGVLARHQVETQFRSYQEKRRRLPGRTPHLF